MPRASGMIARAAWAKARGAGIAVEPLLALGNLTARQIDDAKATLAARSLHGARGAAG